MGMVRNIVVPGILLIFASPVLAASGPFFSLRNTDFVVLISFILFGLVLIYLKVPSMLGKMLDQRAASIKTELDEARALREEAQTILASYERKQKEVSEQAARIVEDAKNEAKAKLLYDEIDNNPLFEGYAAKEDRSLMNVSFKLTNESQKEAFDTAWKAAGISGLNGHRNLGGYRASIYNAMPIESVQVLVDVMKNFA